MSLLNRSLVLLRPRQPFLDWAALDDAEDLAPDVFGCMREDPPSFLVPPCAYFGSARNLVSETWPILFACVLESWSTDQASWPSGRTLEMFREWFEITVSSAVEDVVEGVEIEEE